MKEKILNASSGRPDFFQHVNGFTRIAILDSNIKAILSLNNSTVLVHLVYQMPRTEKECRWEDLARNHLRLLNADLRRDEGLRFIRIRFIRHMKKLDEHLESTKQYVLQYFPRKRQFRHRLTLISNDMSAVWQQIDGDSLKLFLSLEQILTQLHRLIMANIKPYTL